MSDAPATVRLTEEQKEQLQQQLDRMKTGTVVSLPNPSECPPLTAKEQRLLDQLRREVEYERKTGSPCYPVPGLMRGLLAIIDARVPAGGGK